LSAEEKQRLARLKRGPGVNVKGIQDKKLKGKLRHVEKVYREAQEKAAKISEWLLPSESGALEAEGIERTYNFRQQDIVQAVEVGAGRKAFDLTLDQLGPYRLDFTRSGRYMLLGGRRGHLAVMDWQANQLVCEVQVAETTRDVCFLHNEQFWAAAQKKYVYIYDKRGIEVHCLRDHTEPGTLQFLPHHFLLASIGDAGVLRYQDTSTGHIVAQHKTKLGPCHVMRHNPHNAVLCLGHTSGSVTMWTPNLSEPVVKMLCHRGPVNAVAVDVAGRHMVTAGADGQVKVWDIRMIRPLHAYFSHSPASSVDISQRGLLAVGYGRKVQVWQDALTSKAQAPYMSHSLLGGLLQGMRFCPYEDVLSLGHSGGISTILVPGAGEPNFDSFVANPFQSRKERQEAEVHQLLDKLQPDTIVLDPEALAGLRKEPTEVVQERRQAEREANLARLRVQVARNEAKDKMKGKNKPSRRHRKKQVNIVEERKPDMIKKMREEAKRKRERERRERQAQEEKAAAAPRALARFYKR